MDNPIIASGRKAITTPVITQLALCAAALLVCGGFSPVHSEAIPAKPTAGAASSDSDDAAVAIDSLDVNSPSSVSDVVSNALAFKAQLTATQQSVLQQTYTPSLARKWSNLPCGANCRNGIRFSTLTGAQLNAALAVIQSAAGTATNEGYSEFLQIRLADDYLGANGGGANYSGGIYFISFLNTPSTTGPWMLQFGGHHFAANIAFNNGHVVGTTPQFEGVEPTSFTVNGTTYAPLAQEHDTMATMLASLTATQLSTAKLTQTFSDVTMAPGETNGGNGTFPAVKVGIQASALTAEQQQLVLAAMQPWLKDMDDTVAANLLRLYANEINGTYIAYTGNGTSGTPSSFLNANTNYVRLDGPSVWIEFVCQNGVVFPAIHYHSVYRDHTRDYGADLTATAALDLPALQLSSAVSRMIHGTAGTFDIALPLSSEPGVECRSSGGAYTLVYSFSNNIVSGNAAVTSGIGTVSGSPSFTANTMTVNLTGVDDVQKVTVTLNGVTDSFAQVLPDTAISANFLIGDINASKLINASDIGQVKALSGVTLDATNFRADIVVSGAINASDIGLVKSRSGLSVP